MKPRIHLHRRFQDSGWTYDVWVCAMPGATYPRGVGQCPQAAYADWQKQARGGLNGKAR